MGTSRARGEAGRSPTDADRLARVEAWFVRRGVPQLVEGYSTESRVDARAAPWLVVWVVVGTVLWWGVRPGASVPANLGGIAATLAGVAAGLTVLRWMRRRVMWWVDRRLEVLDVFALGVLVAVSSAVLEQSGLQGLKDGGQVLLGHHGDLRRRGSRPVGDRLVEPAHGWSPSSPGSRGCSRERCRSCSSSSCSSSSPPSCGRRRTFSARGRRRWCSGSCSSSPGWSSSRCSAPSCAASRRAAGRSTGRGWRGRRPRT